nr:hypothetical protein OG781_10615 [Streptomyces sp. NBC_00830]
MITTMVPSAIPLSSQSSVIVRLTPPTPIFCLLKAEIGTTVWESRAAARADVFRFIEVEYNRTRLRKHPEFGYLAPLETRARLQHDFTPAA